MIAMRELLGGVPVADVEIKIQQNLQELQGKMNIVRQAWGRPMTVTSGLRTKVDHLRIYSEINARRRKVGLPELKVPMSSRHLSGQAVDISDPDGSLYNWCQVNVVLLEKVGLWCEIKDDQKRVHFQSVPPASGNRFFKP